MLDLTDAVAAELILDSWLAADDTAGEVQVSIDGLTWTSAATIAASDNWATVSADLSPWTGQAVFLRFVLTSEPAESARWMLRNIRAIIQR